MSEISSSRSISPQREPKTLIRYDILWSCIRQGIRHGYFELAAFGVMLLCKCSNKWLQVVDLFMKCSSSETNDFVEPYLKQRLLKLHKRAVDYMSRKGVQKNTQTTRRLLYEMLLELIAARSCTLVRDARVAATSYLAHDAKNMSQLFSHCQTDEALCSGFRYMKQYYNEGSESSAVDCLKWLAFLNAVGGSAALRRVWNFLIKSRTTAINPFASNVYRLESHRSVFDTELSVYEAVLHRFHRHDELKSKQIDSSTDMKFSFNMYPSQRLRSDVKQNCAGFWKRLWGISSDKLDIHFRKLINWEKYISVLYDSSTAVGKNQDTLRLLQHNYSVTDPELFLPDHCGIQRASLIRYDYNNENDNKTQSTDQSVNIYRLDAVEFLWNIERGRSLIFLKKGYQSTNIPLIRKRIRSALGLFGVFEQNQTNRHHRSSRPQKHHKKRPQRRAPGTGGGQRGNNQRKRRESLLTTSTTNADHKQQQGQQQQQKRSRPQRRAPGTGGQRRNQKSKLNYTVPAEFKFQHPGLYSKHHVGPQPMPGLIAQDEVQEAVGPQKIEGNAVVESQIYRQRYGWKSPQWIVKIHSAMGTGTTDTSLRVEQMSEILSVLPIYFDQIKPIFGLTNCSLRWDDGWLIGRDVGTGCPYKLIPSLTSRKHQVIDKTSTGATPVRNLFLDQSNMWTDRQMKSIISNMLFRLIYGIETTTLDVFLYIKRDQTVISIEENTFCDPFVVVENCDEFDVTNLLLLTGINFTSEEAKCVGSYLNNNQNKRQITSQLLEWFNYFSVLPMLSKPITGFPTTEMLRKRSNILLKFFEEL